MRLRAEYGTEEFWTQYHAAVSGTTLPTQLVDEKAGSLAWLIERYRETSAWRDLSLATRRQRENIFKQVIASAGRARLNTITEKTIIAGRERRSATPFQAKHFVATMRGLFVWAKQAGHVNVDPTETVKYPTRKSAGGFPVWDDADVAAYEKRWPHGTRQRVWLAVLVYTGLRRGDAVRLGRQHVRQNIATLRTEKTGTDVHIPLLEPLLEALRAGPTGDLAFICGANGKPMSKESFGNEFSQACRMANVKKSAHGLRKIAATRAAEAGATIAELNAIFGWTGSQMASLYTQAADRARLARGAMHKVLPKGTETPTSVRSG